MCLVIYLFIFVYILQPYPSHIHRLIEMRCQPRRKSKPAQWKQCSRLINIYVYMYVYSFLYLRLCIYCNRTLPHSQVDRDAMSTASEIKASVVEEVLSTNKCICIVIYLFIFVYIVQPYPSHIHRLIEMRCRPLPKSKRAQSRKCFPTN